MIARMESIAGSRDSIAIRVIKYWLPVAMMLAAMFYFSTDTLSNEHTETFVGRILLWLSSHISESVIAVINYIIRKSAHFVEYAILGALLFRAFRADDSVRWRLRWVAYSLISAASWAALDEFHQTFTRTRSGSPWDALLDSSATLFMLLLITFLNRKDIDNHTTMEENGANLSQS